MEKDTAFLESFKSVGYDSFSQVKDLHVSVDDPEKHVGGYVSYNVTTKVGIYSLCSIKYKCSRGKSFLLTLIIQ